MKKLKKLFSALILTIAIFIAVQPTADAQTVEIEYDFRRGNQGWSTGFADYKPNTGTNYELETAWRFMPRKLTLVPARGLYIQGHNRSDDLFMFLKRRLDAQDGVVAGRAYRVEYVIRLASKAPTGCGGVGGAPGEGVYLKAGASPVEPLAVLQADGWLRMNIDKGNQSQGGTAASVAGNIANGIPCQDASPNFPYALIQRDHQHTSNVTANASGEIWLLIGTDSGFEGMTSLYYRSVRVKLIPA